MRVKLIFAYKFSRWGPIEFFHDYTKLSMLALKAYTEDRKKNQPKNHLLRHLRSLCKSGYALLVLAESQLITNKSQIKYPN